MSAQTPRVDVLINRFSTALLAMIGIALPVAPAASDSGTDAGAVLRLTATERNGDAVVRFEATSGDRILGTGSTRIERSKVIPNKMRAASPDAYAETVKAMDAVSARRMNEILAGIDREIITLYSGKYPTCAEASASERSSGRRVSVRLHGNAPGVDETGMLCVIVPRGSTFPGQALGLMENALAAPVTAEMETQREFGLVRERVSDANGERVVLGPFSAGFSAEAAVELRQVADFIQSVVPRESIRQQVAMAVAAVQELGTTEIKRSGDARVSPFPSTAALLLDGEGPVDAKATLLAGLILGLDPTMRIVLFEVGEHVLLGVSIPVGRGDLGIENPSLSGTDPKLYLVLDPRSPAPPGQVSDPALKPVFADGILRRGEVDSFDPVTDKMKELALWPLVPAPAGRSAKD